MLIRIIQQIAWRRAQSKKRLQSIVKKNLSYLYDARGFLFVSRLILYSYTGVMPML